jgi:hypothetical protein
VAQQSEFNTLIAQALEEMQAAMEEQRMRLEDMQATLIALDRHVTALTRRLAIAERQFRPDDDDGQRVLSERGTED